MKPALIRVAALAIGTALMAYIRRSCTHVTSTEPNIELLKVSLSRRLEIPLPQRNGGI